MLDEYEQERLRRIRLIEERNRNEEAEELREHPKQSIRSLDEVAMDESTGDISRLHQSEVSRTTNVFAQAQKSAVEHDKEVEERKNWDDQFRKHVKDPYGEDLIKDTEECLPMIVEPGHLYEFYRDQEVAKVLCDVAKDLHRADESNKEC